MPRFWPLCVNCSVHISQIGFFCPSPLSIEITTLSVAVAELHLDARYTTCPCLCGFFCPLAPLIWIFLSEVLELFRDVRSRCSIAKLSLAALDQSNNSSETPCCLQLSPALGPKDFVLPVSSLGENFGLPFRGIY
jgi:hypothetical protein